MCLSSYLFCICLLMLRDGILCGQVHFLPAWHIYAESDLNRVSKAGTFSTNIEAGNPCSCAKLWWSPVRHFLATWAKVPCMCVNGGAWRNTGHACGRSSTYFRRNGLRWIKQVASNSEGGLERYMVKHTDCIYTMHVYQSERNGLAEPYGDPFLHILSACTRTGHIFRV